MHEPEEPDEAHVFSQEFWDERYAAHDHVWSGRPNPPLVDHATGLSPGVALDVGCGEGADVVWLAERGWHVTGADLSVVALEKARKHADEAGVAERTDWVHVDLLAGDPLPGDADLVSAMFVHVPEADFDRVYATIAGAVRSGRHAPGRGPPPGRTRHRPAQPAPEPPALLAGAGDVAAGRRLAGRRRRRPHPRRCRARRRTAGRDRHGGGGAAGLT